MRRFSKEGKEMALWKDEWVIGSGKFLKKERAGERYKQRQASRIREDESIGSKLPASPSYSWFDFFSYKRLWPDYPYFLT